MTHALLPELSAALDANVPEYATLDRYYAGTQPLAFLAPEAKKALSGRLARMASNIPRLAVTSLAERLRITGLRAGGGDSDRLWRDWIANDLDQLAGVAHREALTLGRSYVMVWADQRGAPKVSVESARQVACLRDPGTRRITAAIKRWETDRATEAMIYEADRITRLRADHLGATVAGFRTVETIDNPLGMVPVVALRNADRLLDEGVSEIVDLVPLVDALNKLLADMLVSSEYFARPRRWGTGIELAEDEDGNSVNPMGDGVRMMIAEAPEAKFGQLPAADLAAYDSAVKVILSQIMAVSALPGHYIGAMSNQPPSADSLRASEASLTARAEARQATFGRAWEDVARLMVAVRTGGDPRAVDVRVQWADAATRSVAQEADAVVKLYQAGLLPSSYALARLGYSDHEIETIRAARRSDALDVAGTDIKGLIGA